MMVYIFVGTNHTCLANSNQLLLSSGWFLACDWLALDSLQLGF
jgi:hypothetical protein